MKQVSIYTVESTPEFDFEALQNAAYKPLGELQSSSIGFVPVYEEELFSLAVNGYCAFKIKQVKKKETKPQIIEDEFVRRSRRLTDKGVEFDTAQLLEEVHQDAMRMADITVKEYLVFYDNSLKQFYFDATRNDAEEGLSLINSICVQPIHAELYKTDPSLTEKMLTGFVLKEDSIPEPFALSETISLGKSTPFGKNSPSANVKVTNTYAGEKEVIGHITKGLVVKELELDYDGVTTFKISNTFEIKTVKYYESLNVKDNDELTEAANFTAKYYVQLPVLSKAISVLQENIDNFTI